MDNNELNELREKVKHEIKLVSQPIDFEQLEKDGLLKKVRKSGFWYDAPNIHLLPKHVTAQIVKVSTSPNGARVKFKKTKRTSI